MANGGYASIVQVAQQAKDNQKTTQTKSNTIVAASGLVVTFLIYILTNLVESGYDWVPGWTPQLITFLGFAATVLGVSKTKNYVTDGTIQQLEKTVLEMIDQNHDNRIQPVNPGILPPEATTPSENVSESSSNDKNEDPSRALPVSHSDDELANTLDALARKFAEER
nr:MAG TPA: hypothetical protein [Caudoviricetes sp.]